MKKKKNIDYIYIYICIRITYYLIFKFRQIKIIMYVD